MAGGPQPYWNSPQAPDWAALINSDPLYQQGQMDLGAASAAAAAARQGGVRQAIIRSGLFGSQDALRQALARFGQQYAGDVDQATLDQAAGNENSVAAQLRQALGQRNLATEDTLAARGILRSGQTGYELGENKRQYDQANYDAMNQLLDYLGGLYGGFAEGENARNAQRAQYGQEASDRILALGLKPPAAPSPVSIIHNLLGPPRPPAPPKRKPFTIGMLK
jgi:hypothetical protein